jgi:stage II sporulation protein M
MYASIQLQKENYENYVIDLIRSLKPQIIFIIGLLSVGIILGYMDTLNLNKYINLVIENLMNTFNHYRGFELFLGILLNNTKATVILLFSGVFLSIFPTLGTLMNGMMIGFVFQSPQLMAGRPAYLIFIQLLPHGVFEIPALILALALGLKLGGWLFKKKKTEHLKNNIKESFSGYVRVILPMLIIAACIETIGMEAMYFLYRK